MISRTSTALTLALAFATPLAAQNATTYRRNPGDTLRYHELTESKVDSNVKGATSTETRRDATAVFAFGAADTARAWFEAFAAVARMQGRETTSPAPLNGPVVLLFRANGVLETPQAGTGGNPFAVFFLRLPDRPLAPGVEWADTMGGKRDTPDGARQEMQYVVKYRVAGDTAVEGGKAFVITAKGDGVEKATRTVGTGTEEQRTRTSETGRIVFSAELGRLLSWDRTVERLGRTTTRGGENLGPARAAHPNGRVDVGATPEMRNVMETHARTHTLIELLPAQQLKAAPTK